MGSFSTKGVTPPQPTEANDKIAARARLVG
jgi:hypothetical protein